MVETIGTGWWKQQELDGGNNQKLDSGNNRHWTVETIGTGQWKQ